MLDLGFSFHFNGSKLDFYLNNALYGHSYTFQMVSLCLIWIIPHFLNFMAYDDNVVSNSFKWHARLGHVRRKKIEWLHLLEKAYYLLGSLVSV